MKAGPVIGQTAFPRVEICELCESEGTDPLDSAPEPTRQVLIAIW